MSSKKMRFRWALTSRQGHHEPNPAWVEAGHQALRAMADQLSRLAGGKMAVPGGTWNELFEVPMTAHFLGGAPISDSPEHGVIDPCHRVHGYATISIVDGTAISANLAVNPSLTITAPVERSFSLWPAMWGG